jgi:hypothetical protein
MGLGAWREGEKHFLIPMWKMGAKTECGGSHLLVLYWRVGGLHMIKGNGSGWLRWLLKQEGVTLAPGVIFWIWVIVLLRDILSNLLVILL